ncbi:MAG: diguanylate cyclase domain-containing protein, partial [Acidimicrobiales bacterium]
MSAPILGVGADTDPNQLHALLEGSHEVLIVLDTDGRISWYSPAADAVLGWGDTQYLGQRLLDVVHTDDRDRIARLLDLVSAEASCEASYRIRCALDEFRALKAQFRKFQSGHILVRHRDPTAVEEAAQMRHLATHDQLTGLPTRLLFVEALDRAIPRLGRTKKHVAAMFLDLDGFKAVNDGLGHDAGDELLAQVALRLENTLRSTDTVARFGGDE